MDSFFTWLSTNPTATITVGILVTTFALINLIAFLQGREISFWPPKIGSIPQKINAYKPADGQSYIQPSLTEQTGLIAVFDDLEAAKEEMQADFQKATDSRLLLQIGQKEFGDRESSFFASLAQRKNQLGTNIKILSASENSFFLSEQRARFRGTPVEKWREGIRRLKKEINLLRDEYDVRIEAREHSEPFLWRIFIFDDIVYVSGYLYVRNNDRNAAVYKFKKGGGSLYTVFSRYFDYLWLKYDPTSSNDPIEKWSTWL